MNADLSKYRWSPTSLAVCFGWCWLLGVVGQAAEIDPVESARRALSKERLPWYDSRADEVRDIGLRDGDAKADNRSSDWVKKRKKEEPYDWESSNSGGRGGGGGSGFWNFMQVLFWVIIVLVLATVVALLIWAFINNENRQAAAAAAESTTRASSDDVARVENLPFEVREPQADLLTEARRQYEQGNYAEAIVYLFSYQLVELDKCQVIHLAKGKTNRQYVRESRRRPTLRGILESTMRAFEDVFFGHHSLDKDRFETCWRQLDAFHQDVQQVTT